MYIYLTNINLLCHLCIESTVLALEMTVWNDQYLSLNCYRLQETIYFNVCLICFSKC